LIPRSPYHVSFWVEVLLSKYRYAQPVVVKQDVAFSRPLFV
jgi:hypothetical protein